MRAYYNECDSFAAAWLRELIREGLIADGDVDERSIVDVRPRDLDGYGQCHFFAGIAGWPHALRLAGWPDSREVWTGSCPCQFRSSAARGRHAATDMWPAFRTLVAAARPGVLLSEQVANCGGWFDGVCDDLDALGYTVGAAILPACSVGQDHQRARLFFVGHADGNSQPGLPLDAEVARLQRNRCDTGAVVRPDGIPGRMALLRGFGNALVPGVAAAFIEAYCDAIDG